MSRDLTHFTKAVGAKTRGAIRRIRRAGRAAVDALLGRQPAAAPPDPNAVEPELQAPEPTAAERFHHTLHELRSIELERVPKGASRALSIGASGGWYFEWFERHYGPLESHIGVEAYESQPTDLPANAEWIHSTADRFEGVADGSVELVFAGQTTEHLWAEELVGFLSEAKRVLSPGGLLVVDSPNRLATEHLEWSHGGHTVELSSAEWIELLDLAGFEPVRESSLWSCVIDGEYVYPEDRFDSAAEVTRRIATAEDHPEQAFVWWVDARSTAAEARTAELSQRVHDL